MSNETKIELFRHDDKQYRSMKEGEVLKYLTTIQTVQYRVGSIILRDFFAALPKTDGIMRNVNHVYISPDLSPIEHVLVTLKRRVKA